MPSVYQKASVSALMGLFLEAQGHPLPQHTQVKSASSLSRFLNHYTWSTRRVILTTRKAVLAQIAQHRPRKDMPLRILIDLTTLEKCGNFTHLSTATDDPKIPDLWVRMLNGKRGLHLVVLYLVLGEWRVPWSFRVWRGYWSSESLTLGVQVAGDCSPVFEPRGSSHCSGRYRVWHCRVSQCRPKAHLASGGWHALYPETARRSNAQTPVSP